MKKSDMSIVTSADAIKFYKRCINLVCSYNFLCLRALSQERKESELEVSETTREWLSKRHEVFADSRVTTIEHLRSQFPTVNDLFLNPRDNAKQTLWKEWLKANPDENRTFEECFENYLFDDDNLNLEYYNYLSTKSGVPAEDITPDEPIEVKYTKLSDLEKIKIFESLQAFTVYDSVIKDLGSMQQIFDTVCDRLTNSGYNTIFGPLGNINSTDDVKAISAETIICFNEILNQYLLEASKVKKQLEIEYYKKCKQLKKDPQNSSLQADLSEVVGRLEFLDDKLKTAITLDGNIATLLDRLEAYNTSPFTIGDKIIESLTDFAFGVSGTPQLKKIKKEFSVDGVNAHKSELADITMQAIEFPVLTPLIQKLCFETGLKTEVNEESFEYIKQLLDFLTEENNPNIDLLNTVDEVKQTMVFSTPYGKVWFDGKVLHEIDDHQKTHTVASLKNFEFDEEKGEFVKIAPSKLVSSFSAALANKSAQAPAPQTGKFSTQTHKKK